MSLGLILVIILIIFLLGGFSGRFGGYGYGMGHSGMGLGGLILVVLLVLLLLGRLLAQPYTLNYKLNSGGQVCVREFIICSVKSRISIKRAYIRLVLEMTSTGPVADRLTHVFGGHFRCVLSRRLSAMAAFSYKTSAELFPAAIRKK